MGSHYVAQAGLDLLGCSSSEAQMLGLQIRATEPGEASQFKQHLLVTIWADNRPRKYQNVD